eukprot:865482-Pleurochrysis_carterae.AAC.1
MWTWAARASRRLREEAGSPLSGPRRRWRCGRCGARGSGAGQELEALAPSAVARPVVGAQKMSIAGRGG